jgi:hypothetical protein
MFLGRSGRSGDYVSRGSRPLRPPARMVREAPAGNLADPAAAPTIPSHPHTVGRGTRELRTICIHIDEGSLSLCKVSSHRARLVSGVFTGYLWRLCRNHDHSHALDTADPLRQCRRQSRIFRRRNGSGQGVRCGCQGERRYTEGQSHSGQPSIA